MSSTVAKPCVKMLMREHKMFKQNTVPGTFMKFNENDIQNSKFMIIGTQGTPFQGTFFMFRIYYTDDYPYKEPSVRIMNQSYRTHPNLYVNGKVCVSILGTWGKNNWSAALKTRGILASIQSLLIKNPIQQEPGYSDIQESWKDSIDFKKRERYKIMEEYNIISSYYSLKYTAFDVLLNGVNGFEEFQDEAIIYFKINWKDYLNQVEYFKHLNGKHFRINIYNLSVKINYHQLKNDFNKICKIYCVNPNIETNITK